MPQIALEFDWLVPSSGYRWINAELRTEGERTAGPALIPAVSNAESFAPESASALFREFADLKPNKEGILAFSNRYGNLGHGSELFPARGSVVDSDGVLRGSMLRGWQLQILHLGFLVEIWDLLVRGDHDRIRRHIKWRDDSKYGPAVLFERSPERTGSRGIPKIGPSRTLIASGEVHPELFERFHQDNPLPPAWIYLQEQIDDALSNTEGVAARMKWEMNLDRPVVCYAAPNLLAAVWFQFADAVSNGRTYGRCRECCQWFEVAPDVARTHRRYCSEKCRSKAYRERQDRARQMYAGKKSFSAIAAELESDPPTVKRWITGSKE